MNSVKFNNYHAYRDLNLILSSKSIGSAEAKTNIIEIPGADGSLDLTDYFGEPKFKNRKLQFEFTYIANGEKQIKHYSMIKNVLHGQRMKITLDAEPTFFYIGRLSVSALKSNKNINTITVDCDCEPYKYHVFSTIRKYKINQNPQTILLTNDRKSVIPSITSTGTVNFKFNGINYTVNEGTYIDESIILKYGTNIIENVNSNSECDLIFEYREGSL